VTGVVGRPQTASRQQSVALGLQLVAVGLQCLGLRSLDFNQLVLEEGSSSACHIRYHLQALWFLACRLARSEQQRLQACCNLLGASLAARQHQLIHTALH
jgi:hypothetical protein